MTTVTVSTPARFTAEIRGRRALDVLKRANVTQRIFDWNPPSGGAPCWTCPASRVGDVVAAGEIMRGIRVVVLHEQGALI